MLLLLSVKSDNHDESLAGAWTIWACFNTSSLWINCWYEIWFAMKMMNSREDRLDWTVTWICIFLSHILQAVYMYSRKTGAIIVNHNIQFNKGLISLFEIFTYKIRQRIWDMFYQLSGPKLFRNQPTFFLFMNMQLIVDSTKIWHVQSFPEVTHFP